MLAFQAVFAEHRSARRAEDSCRKALPAIEIQVVTLEDMPLYNEDLDRKPAVPAVAAFKRIIAESDGVLIAQTQASINYKFVFDFDGGPSRDGA